MISLEPFDKWGLDFVGPVYPSLVHKRYILVCIDYLTKWDEVKAIKVSTEQKVVEFLQESIFSIFGYPREIVRDH
jgi:hypothetical protein